METDFFELVSRCRIVIPGIQREYAQGRMPDEKAESIRKKFLPELIDVALGAASGKTLDYVYGVKNERGDFIPLDGQQRLTTLFLLNWYYRVESCRIPVGSFAYLMRRKARVFVDGLLQHPRKSLLLSNDPILEIKNSEWIGSGMLGDATVSGMMVTLRCIHDINKMRSPNVDLLLKAHERLERIKFWTQSIPGADSDDVYLKMNARGLALTRWENIKAVIDERVPSEIAADWRTSIDGDWSAAMEYLLPQEVYPAQDDFNKLGNAIGGGTAATDIGDMLCQCDLKLRNAADQLKNGYQNVFDLALVISLQDSFASIQEGCEEYKKALDELRETICGSTDRGELLKQLKTLAWSHKLESFLYANPLVVSKKTYEVASALFQTLTRWSSLVIGGWGHERKDNLIWEVLKGRSKKPVMSNFPAIKARDGGFVSEYLFSSGSLSYYKGLRFYAFSKLSSCREIANRELIKISRVLNLLDAAENDAEGATLEDKKFFEIKKSIDDVFDSPDEENIFASGKLGGFGEDALEEEGWKFEAGYDPNIFELECVDNLWGNIRFVWDGSSFSTDLMNVFRENFTSDGGTSFKNFERILRFVDYSSVDKGRGREPYVYDRLPIPHWKDWGAISDCVWRRNLRREFFRAALIRMLGPEDWIEQPEMEAFRKLLESGNDVWHGWSAPAIFKEAGSGRYYLRATKMKMDTAIRIYPYTAQEKNVLKELGRNYFWSSEDKHGVRVIIDGEKYRFNVSDIQEITEEGIIVRSEDNGEVVRRVDVACMKLP